MLGVSIFATLMSSVAPLFMFQMAGMPPERIARGTVQAVVLGMRGAVDLRYDGILYDERSRGVSLRGVTVVPPDSAGMKGCTIRIDAVTLTPTLGEDRAGVGIEADDIEASGGCAAGPGMVAVAMLGPGVLTADRLSLDLDYGIGASVLTMTGHLETPRTGTLDIAMAASGLHATREPVLDDDGMELYAEDGLGGTLDSLEITLADIDHLRSLMPMMGLGEEEAGEQAAGFLRDALGDVAETPEGEAFIKSAEREVARFAEEGGTLGLRMTAPAPVAFGDLADTSGPEDTVPLLHPVMVSRPEAAETIFAFGSLEEAVEGAAADRRRALAAALEEGRGLPRSEARAAEIYAELAGEDDAEAALSAARLLAGSDPARAYALALDGGAAGADGARLLLDRIEGGMALAEILALQGAGDARETDPPADVAALRRRARQAFDGQGARRDYASALFHASLAAAAGDRASRHLQDRLAGRFADEPLWGEVVSDAAERALTAWTEGGLGAAFAE